MLLLLGWLTLLTLGDSSGQSVRNMPLKYNMQEESYMLVPMGTQIVMANIGCPSLDNAKVEVCAELPLNWPWARDSGIVYLNIFNTSDTKNLSLAIASTGKPGNGKDLIRHCANILQWPGGNMYVRVDSNNYAPVGYVVSATVIPSPQPTEIKLRTRNIQAPSTGAGNPLKMVGTAVLEDSMYLAYNEHMVLGIDLCYESSINYPIMRTSLVAKTGTLIHYVCKDLPCTPDSSTVRCSSASPLPIAGCITQFNPSDDKAYVYISAKGGVKQSNGTFMSNFLFAVYLL